MRKVASVLDDVPMSVSKTIQQQDAKRRRLSSRAPTSRAGREEDSSVRATVASSSTADPALMPFKQKRDQYEEAIRSTKEHLAKMKKRLQPKSSLMVIREEGGEQCESEEKTEDASLESRAWSKVTSEPSSNTEAEEGSPFVNAELFCMEVLEEGDWEYGITHNMQEVFAACQIDMLKESTPRSADFDMLPALDETSELRRDSGDPRTATPATPSTRARIPKHYWGLMMDIPPKMRRPLSRMEMIDAYRRIPLNSSNRGHQPVPGQDYWMFVPSRQELWRVHLQSRRRMFDPLKPADHLHPQDDVELPPALTENGIQGVRATQVRKDRIQPSEDDSEFMLDNVRWYGWNTQLDLQRPWKGITRFQTRLMFAEYPVLHTWLEARSSAENLWRMLQRTMETFVTMREHSGWPDESAVREVAERQGLDFMELKVKQAASKDELMEIQREVATVFAAFVSANQINPPNAHGPWQGLQELVDDPTGTTTQVLDVAKPETGKLRQWSQLSEAWQRAFEKPILDALDIYFQHDALAPAMPDEVVQVDKLVFCLLIIYLTF